MTYDPDEQDEIIGDAMAVGGPAFVEELHYAAMDAAEARCPWDGAGTEPEGYRRGWITAARGIVTERRAELSARPDGHSLRPSDDAPTRSHADPAIGPGH